MDSQALDELQRTFRAEGPSAAVDRLCTRLREQKDYTGLFYALLMKKRHELGVSPIPTGPSQDLPESAHAPYENAIREAGRLVGRLYLDDGDIAQAWPYFRMINEPEPVVAALDKAPPSEDEGFQQLISIAFFEGVHPCKGFDWLLERNGICNAITTLSSSELPHSTEVRRHCIQRLVQCLYRDLVERMKADVSTRTGETPAVDSVRELLKLREWNFEEDYAHVDVSHLSAVVQMSISLEPCPELNLARELCEYGDLLQGRMQYGGDPPFERLYHAYGLYLAALAGDKVEEALEYFRTQAEAADPQVIGTYPAEVLINLLLRLNRPAEALAAGRRFLAGTDNRRLSCPSIAELCQKANDYRTLAEIAREQGDAVHFIAGLIAAGK